MTSNGLVIASGEAARQSRVAQTAADCFPRNQIRGRNDEAGMAVGIRISARFLSFVTLNLFGVYTLETGTL
ncbi:hypothetical protein, partial [Sphingopyxis granuli]|uniref:hypothetical protein n=1 Tax=Sphingopyxis granuli TaxID=267128 RepID=UPI001C3F2AB9